MRALLSCVLILSSFTQIAFAFNDEAVELYLKQVKPVLTERCFACHGALKQEGNLRLDTVAQMQKGGDSGAAIVAANRNSSLLLQRITSTDPSLRMPHEGEPLKPEQIEAISRWIDLNAAGPMYEQAESDPREHWAFRALQRPVVPVDPTNWSESPIDNFIAADHRQHNLTPQSAADRLLQVRRLYIDLVGMSPSPDELSLIDFSIPNWYQQLVSRLLDDQRHGERWARHWMDIWRYSDWWGLGDQLRNSQYHMWHWRDWIIQSLNQDVPYDEMLRQMLAADEIYPDDLEKLRATGFLARNYFLFNRNPWMEETVEHVSKSLLGLTMNCAKCHDHKFDPFEQVDFYRMRAFFEPYHVRLDMLPGEVDLNKNGLPRVFDALGDMPTYLYNRGDENQPDKSSVIAPGVPKLFDFKSIEVRSVTLPQAAWQPEYRQWVVDNHLAVARRRLAETESALAPIQTRLAESMERLKQLVAMQNGPKPSDTPPQNEKTPITATQGDSSSAVKEAEAAAKITEQELRVAQLEQQVANAELHSIQARAEWIRAAKPIRAIASVPTDKAQPVNPVQATSTEANESHSEQARIDAIKAKRQLEVAKADLMVGKSELALLRAKPDAQKKSETELDKARKSHDAAKAKLSEAIAADEQPEVLTGARWTPTRFLNSTADDPPVKFASQSTGRRRALAEWITDPKNPLTARVAVNHLWNRHFGTPLVATVFDFGRKGSPPTDQALLDWLACELIDSGWSMKHLHRLIVNSSTYRLASSNLNCEANIKVDPDNKFWWRRNSIRLESQAVRDTILYQANELDVTLYGPTVPSAEQAMSKRRSLYFFHSNNERNQFLTAFDEASVKECYRRDQSIVPQQALALVNSGLIQQSTAKIASRLSSVAENQNSFVTAAFRILLGIEPSEEELRMASEAVEQWQKIDGFSNEQVRQMLVWTLINHNDFVTLR